MRLSSYIGAAALICVACGSDPESSSDTAHAGDGGTGGASGGSAGVTSQAGGGGTGGSGSTSTGGGGTGGNGSTGGSGSTETGKRGSVSFIDGYFFASGAMLRGMFWDTPAVDRCTRLHDEAGCLVRQCPPSDPAAPPLTFPHAGTLTYESPGIAGVVQATPDAAGNYLVYEDTRADRFSVAVPGVFRATGGDVPAFEQALDFPLRVILDEPAATGGILTVARDSDLVLRWSRALTTSIVVLNLSEQSDAENRYMSCSFDGGAGMATIPAAVLADAPAGLGSLYAFNKVDIQVGDYAVVLFSGDQVVTPDRTDGILVSVE